MSVRGSNPHLSFNRPLPTRQTDIIILDVTIAFLCDELIIRPEESYQLWCVVVCNQETSRIRRPWPALGPQRHRKQTNQCFSGPGSSVDIATDLRDGRSGIESRWGRDFPPVLTGPGAHPASCKMGTVSFPGVKCGRGVLLTTHPILMPRLWNSRAIPLPTLWATPGL